MAFETLSQKRKQVFVAILFGVTVTALVLFIIFEIVVLKRGGLDTVPSPTDKLVEASPELTEEPTEEPTPAPTEEPWIAINEDGNTIGTRFNPPKGYTRVDLAAGSFGEYLRNYPLKPFGEKALLFSGAESDEASSIGVFKQVDPLIKNQQCADTVIMLYSEYLYGRGRFNDISFNFLSGFKCDFNTWAKGYRDVVNGKDVEWVLSTDKPGVLANDYTYDNFYRYIKEVYVYANTDSLAVQFPSVKAEDIKVGDVIIGTVADLKKQALLISPTAPDTISYGHAILVADMAVNEAGEKVYLFVEGTTPATECCVVENPDGVSVCWYKFDSTGSFVKGKSGIIWKGDWAHSLEG